MAQSSKSIFITGGASGIGRGIAVRFANEGWLVGLGDLNAGGMAETQAMLPEGRCHSYALDVTDAAQWKDVLSDFAREAGGAINTLANNAGLPSGGPMAEVTLEEMDALLNVNLRGVFYGAKMAYPYLKAAAPEACLLNTASAAAFYGMANQSIYGATKAGVRSMTESLEAEWADEGIKVRSLMPRFIDTPLLQNPPNRSRNTPIRDAVVAAGLEFTPVEVVADEAWRAANEKQIHRVIGKSARKMKRVAKWAPQYLRRRARMLADAHNAAEKS